MAVLADGWVRALVAAGTLMALALAAYGGEPVAKDARSAATLRAQLDY